MQAPDYPAMLEEALEAGRKRDYARSVEILTRIVGGTDSLPQALLYLGRGYHALGDYARAVQALQFYLRQRPGSIPGLFFLGRAYLALDEYPQAIRHLKRVVERDPRFAPAYGLLGLASLKARRPDKAIWWFAKSLEVDPQNKRLQVGYLNTALVLAIRLFHRGDFDDAIRLFNEVLEQRRGSILPHLYLASIYRETGREDLALYHMESASALSPQDPFLHLQKGLILLARGKKSEAADEIRFGSRLLNTSAAPSASPEEVQRFMVLNLYRQHRYREAVFHATRLLRARYDDPQLHALVAECCRTMGDLAKAENHYRRALEKDRASLEIRYGLLAVLWERGDYTTLLAESERVLQKSRNDDTGAYFHSLAMSRSGADVTAVLPELQRQVRARGPDPVLMTELGAAYARAGLPELAEGWYERALKLAPPSEQDLETLADIYGTLGRKKKLVGVFRRYLEISPDNRPIRRKYVRLLLEQDAFSEASEQISLLLPLEPSNVKLKSTLAVCYRRMGRYGDALVIIRDLLSGTPGSIELMKAAVYCLDKMGSRGVAMRAIESFLRAHGDSLSLVLMLGVLQFQDNALEKASSTFRRAVSLAPKDWRANRNLGMVYRRMGNETFADKFLQKAASYRTQAQPRAQRERRG